MLRFPLIIAGLAAALVILGALVWTPDRPVAALKARWARPPSKFVPIDGLLVHVRDEGLADDPMPIVLLHGTGGSLHTWEGLVDRLKASHRIISFDRPGFGLTGPNASGDYSMAYYVGFLGRLLDTLGVRRCILVGNSSGGRMAWEFAVAEPGRVGRLVLVAPAGYPRTTPLPLGLRIAMSPVGPVLLHLLPKAAVAKSVRATYGDPGKVTPEVVDRNYEIIMRQGDRKALGATLRQAQTSDHSALIAKVRAPTLIMWGTKDTVIPPADAQRFHSAIKGSTLVLLPGVGHLAQEEDPAGTAAAFERFMEETRGRP